jgi:hypothetical protein
MNIYAGRLRIFDSSQAAIKEPRSLSTCLWDDTTLVEYRCHLAGSPYSADLGTFLQKKRLLRVSMCFSRSMRSRHALWVH